MQLGNYHILQQLGHGGCADVYLGEHIYLKTQAAIKILHTHIEPEEIESFRNEALLIIHLVHPNIIRVLDFGVEKATPFLVMEYASGGTLRQKFPKGTKLPPAVFMPYLKQVAEAHDRCKRYYSIPMHTASRSRPTIANETCYYPASLTIIDQQ